MVINLSDELKQFLPGLMQGITRVSISYPFDVLKVNMQKMVYKTTYSSFKNIIKTDPAKLYRGSLLSYSSVSIERSIQFYILEKYTSQYNPYICGAAVSLFSSIYNVPISYLTTSIALQNNRTSLKQYLYNIYKAGNNIYKGYLLETCKNQLGSTLFLGSYYQIRKVCGNNLNLSPFYGALSGLTVWAVIFPIDTLRTEYQTSNTPIKNIIAQRIKDYGIRSFYKGITPIIIRTIPSSSLGMYVYEYVRKHVTPI